jgi:hypothetical protein
MMARAGLAFDSASAEPQRGFGSAEASPSRASPSRASPSRASPSRASPSRQILVQRDVAVRREAGRTNWGLDRAGRASGGDAGSLCGFPPACERPARKLSI